MLSAPRPGRASKMMAFSSDVDLAALGRSGSSGSDGDGQRGSKAVPLTSQLYNTLVGAVLPADCLFWASQESPARETDLWAMDLSRMGCSRQEGDASLTSQLYSKHENSFWQKLLKLTCLPYIKLHMASVALAAG